MAPLRLLLCGLCLLWNFSLVQSAPEVGGLKIGFLEALSSSKDNQLIPFEDECVALIRDTFVNDGIKLELVCSAQNGLSYSIPSIDANWIIEKSNSGDLVNGKTTLTLPPDAMLDMFTHEIFISEPPGLMNNYEARNEFELAMQTHRRLQTPSVSLVPSRQPSRQPSKVPTPAPSRVPSREPSKVPTPAPSRVPSRQPSKVPTTQPSSMPSRLPSVVPSRQPSSMPSIRPSVFGSQNPSKQPSRIPSSLPSITPSRVPSRVPSRQPSSLPSIKPSLGPSKQPSLAPSLKPSLVPSLMPSSQPSKSNAPSKSDAPSSNPSGSSKPSKSDTPSLQPSSLPSIKPSMNPSNVASIQPSRIPSLQPSAGPSRVPSLQPSGAPSKSLNPSAGPSNSDSPSAGPSKVPSLLPSLAPSHLPTIPGASARPSNAASANPSRQPSMVPSMLPSILPSKIPTLSPSLSSNPTPSGILTANPTPSIPIERTGTIEINIGLDGLEILANVCTGLEGFIAQAIRDTYGSLTITTIVCTQAAQRRRELQASGFLQYEKPVLVTVTTKFPDFRVAPREFGFIEYLEELMISEKSQQNLPGIIQQAIVGTGIEGVHVAIVMDPQQNKNVLVVAFGNDAPTASPTANPNSTGSPAPVAPASTATCNLQYLVSLLLCVAVGGVSMMNVF